MRTIKSACRALFDEHEAKRRDSTPGLDIDSVYFPRTPNRLSQQPSIGKWSWRTIFEMREEGMGPHWNMQYRWSLNATFRLSSKRTKGRLFIAKNVGACLR